MEELIKNGIDTNQALVGGKGQATRQPRRDGVPCLLLMLPDEIHQSIKRLTRVGIDGAFRQAERPHDLGNGFVFKKAQSHNARQHRFRLLKLEHGVMENLLDDLALGDVRTSPFNPVQKASVRQAPYAAWPFRASSTTLANSGLLRTGRFCIVK